MRGPLQLSTHASTRDRTTVLSNTYQDSTFQGLHQHCKLRNINANTLNNFFVAEFASTSFATSTITQCFSHTSSPTCSQTSHSRLLRPLLYPNPQSHITAAMSSPSTTAAHTLGYPHTIAVKESTTTRIRTNTSRRLHMTCSVAAGASSTSESSPIHIVEVRGLLITVQNKLRV
jgi:hypothetical protein